MYCRSTSIHVCTVTTCGLNFLTLVVMFQIYEWTKARKMQDRRGSNSILVEHCIEINVDIYRCINFWLLEKHTYRKND